ncbi:hypothetical protein X797_004318 [Metarhizium robertsii]|uniref:Uncharacterized protein n=1 Tax=Metarhizium robertsii TaxID=568076 RepID=A0A0A1UW99_9HYPO|nr:hypothetical protein X797_004318 [Metarhizium robertsii]
MTPGLASQTIIVAFGFHRTPGQSEPNRPHGSGTPVPANTLARPTFLVPSRVCGVGPGFSGSVRHSIETPVPTYLLYAARGPGSGDSLLAHQQSQDNASCAVTRTRARAPSILQ